MDAYVANSYGAAERLRRLVGDKPVWVVPNGIDGAPPREVVRQADPARPSLLCLARIDANKGQRVLLEAVRLLRGRGWPGKTPGDQIVTLVVRVPPATSDEQRALYEQLAAAFDFDPRA